MQNWCYVQLSYATNLRRILRKDFMEEIMDKIAQISEKFVLSRQNIVRFQTPCTKFERVVPLSDSRCDS